MKLASDPDRVFTREQLLRDVWGFRTYVPTRTLESHASRDPPQARGGRAARLGRERVGRRLQAPARPDLIGLVDVLAERDRLTMSE